MNDFDKTLFKPYEVSRRGHVRLQYKVFPDGVAKLRKWNYRAKRWGRWGLL
jgi:hypothetical protein